MVRIAAVAGVVLAFLAVGATPASAHTISGPKPMNYRSHVVSITPPVPGLSARAVDLGNKFELTNRSSTEVTVLGYESEPYLRIGPNGVFENLHSQATYINRTRQGGTVPVGVDTSPTATPDWKKISDGHSWRWHDHRIHWMGGQPPPQVTAAPDKFQELSRQNVVLDRNGERVAISVELDWVPGPSGLPWAAPLAVLFAVGVIGAVSPKRWRLLAVLIGVLVVSDMAHSIGFEIPRPGGNLTKTAQFFTGSFVSIAVWIAAIPTMIALTRRRIEALYGVVFVALLVALIGGATDLSALWKSQLPDVGPPWLTRVEVVIALGLGGGIVVGAFIRMIRTRSVAIADGDGRGQWLSLLVTGLSDAELTRITRELDADEVLEVAFRELAARATPARDALTQGCVTFVATDQASPVVWSIACTDSTADVRATRGRVEPGAVEVSASFAVLLQLLAGTLLVGDATDRGLVTTTGDAGVLARLAPYLPESSAPGSTPVRPSAEDPASAS